MSADSQDSLSSANSLPKDEPALDVLVSHLLASKRSLESINRVWRANEIVTAARAALEESVVLSARTGFLRRSISSQVKLLRKVRNELEHVYDEGDQDFRTVIKSMDAANERLQKTMDALRSTIVEAAFRPTHEEPMSLLDFVDEQGVEAAQSALKESIDRTRDARADFKETIDSFDNELKAIKTAVSTSSSSSSSPSNSTQTPPIPALLHSLESHAHEMAHLLDSLVHHFDRCVQVIRHTEGGTLAVKTFTQAHPLPNDLHISDRDFNASDPDTTEPFMTPEERAEILSVLNNDAAEVEDVVQDIKDRSTEMESQCELITSHVQNLSSQHNQILTAFSFLDTIGSQKLPIFVLSSSTFLTRYNDAKVSIEEQMVELNGMREFYEGYAASYDSLIVEVARRREAERRVQDVVKRSMAEVERLREGDRSVREGWRESVEGSLPSDLWVGVGDEPPKWEAGVVGVGGADEDGEGGEEAREAPELKASVVRRARERLG